MKKHKFNIFPEMAEDDYKSLLDDLSSNGYDASQPVYILDDKILDGWNRQKACDELNIKPTYKNFIGTEIEAINFVMRTNKRRNLNSSQWAVIANEAEEIIEAIQVEARKKQIRKPISVV